MGLVGLFHWLMGIWVMVGISITNKIIILYEHDTSEQGSFCSFRIKFHYIKARFSMLRNHLRFRDCAPFVCNLCTGCIAKAGDCIHMLPRQYTNRWNHYEPVIAARPDWLCMSALEICLLLGRWLNCRLPTFMVAKVFPISGILI